MVQNNLKSSRRVSRSAQSARIFGRVLGQLFKHSSVLKQETGRAVTSPGLFEKLEERRFLTVAGANSTLIFRGEDGNPIQITIRGDASIEAVGSRLDSITRQPVIIDVPATIDGPTGQIDVLGGFGGLDGIGPVSDFNAATEAFLDTTDSAPGGGPFNFEAPDADLNWTALASNSRGETWGLNLASVQVGDFTIIRLQAGQINNDTGAVSVDDAIGQRLVNTLPPLATPPDDPQTRIVQILDGAFNPSNANQYFFLADVTISLRTLADATPTDTTVSSLFRYNIGSGELIRIPGFFNSDVGGFVETRTRVQAFSIQDDGQALVFGTVPDIQGRGDDRTIVTTTGLFRTSLTQTNSIFDSVVPVALAPEDGGDLEPVTELVSIEIVPGENQFFAVDTIGSDAQLLRFDNISNTDQVIGRIMGALADPDQDGEDRQRGTELLSLAWNKTIANPYQIGSQGSLLGVDSDTDELVALDTRQRFSNVSLYRLVITPRSPTSQVIITTGTANEFGGDYRPVVFSGTPGNIGGNTLTSAGGVLIGQRSDNGQAVLSIDSDTFVGDPFVNRLAPSVTPGLSILGTLARVFVDGTITGGIDSIGAIDTLYVGNLLLGDANGDGGGRQTNNLSVRGDLRNLIVRGDSGFINDPDLAVAPFFETGNSFNIGGIVHSIEVNGIYRGRIDVQGSNSVSKISSNLAEIENRIAIPAGGNEADIIAQSFRSGQISNQAITNNDSIGTAQFLGTQLNAQRRGGGITVSGNLQRNIINSPDTVDIYSMALIAGQTVQTQLSAGFGSAIVVVIDPDGRIIASDNRLTNEAFRFTTDRPGVYSFQVLPNIPGLTPIAYNLAISNAGDIALGGVTSPNSIWFNNPDASLRVRNQDLGAIVSGGILDGLNEGPPFTVNNGNIRAIVGGTGLGTGGLGGVTRAIELQVPNGSVGLVRASSGSLALNFGAVSVLSDPVAARSIGGDYQIVEAPLGDVTANLVADRGIGVIRGAFIGTGVVGTPGFYAVNADKSGDDGFIDLIDSTNSIGSFINGGPAIDVGPNGNARFIRFGTTIFRDRQFGGGAPEATTLPAGRSVTLIDDSGTQVTLRPLTGTIGIIPINTIDPNLGQLTVTTYPVRSGGAVILSANTTGGGLQITGRGGRRAEITTVTTQIAGPTFINTPTVTASTQRSLDRISQSTTDRNRILIDGSANIALFDLSTTGNFSDVINNTGGEIVNLDAGAINRLEADTLGFARPTRGAVAVNGVATFNTTRYAAPISPNASSNSAIDGDAYPFVGQKNAITLGNAVSIRSRNALGNIVVGGSVNEISANTDGRFSRSELEGIVGPVVTSGQIRTINIGEGIAAAGSGLVGQAGIFAGGVGTGLATEIGGVIGNVTAQNGANIYGSVVATSRIEGITLRDGSFIGANVGLSTYFDFASDFNQFTSTAPTSGSINRPIDDLGAINVRGNGGIIGSTFTGGNIGRISVEGFGFINSSIVGPATAVIAGINAGGLGIRGSSILGGSRIGDVRATANSGETLSVKNFSGAVRLSENSSNAFNPVTGQQISRNSDLYLALNAELATPRVTPATPRVGGVTTGGIIENTIVSASRDVGSVTGYRIRETRRTSANSNSFANSINVGGTIGTVSAVDTIAGLRLVAGSVGTVRSGNSMDNVRIIATNRIDRVEAGDDIGRRVFIDAGGTGGVINNVVAGDNLLATILAGQRIGTIRAGGDIGSNGTIGTSTGIRSLGTIGTIQAEGSIRAGTRITASLGINLLDIQQDVEINTIIRAASYTTQRIGGTVFGEILIA